MVEMDAHAMTAYVQTSLSLRSTKMNIQVAANSPNLNFNGD